jgi:4'-phosphopantetheinyl transferase
MDQPREVVEALASTLDDREQAAATQRRRGTRDRYVVAHGATRAILGAALGEAPHDIAFGRRCVHCGDPDHGKPVVDGAPSFSLSHSGAVGVLALSPANVGVDVETVRPRARLDRLARRVLDDAAFAEWGTQPDAERLTAFLRAWTAKEAYLKAVGLGLVRPLRTVRVVRDGWAIESFVPGRDAVASVAVETAGAVRVDVATWAPDAGVSLSA